MHNGNKWTIKGLEELIRNQVKESIDIEYKNSMALKNTDGSKNEISKDVSAFANSAGGVIIYGIDEENHLPKGIDDGVNPNEISKEWVEQVINSRIQRKIENIQINQIHKSSNPGSNVVYVIEIPQSSRAPHQANDKKFYKRYNFMSQPMEEYEIRDVSRRSETPELELISEITGEKIELRFNSGAADERYGSLDLKLLIVNKAIEPASYAVVDVVVPQEVTFVASHTRSRVVNGERVFQYLHGNDKTIPLFNGVNFSFMDSRISLKFPPKQTYKFSWEIRSPKMNIKRSGFVLNISNEDETYYAQLAPEEC